MTIDASRPRKILAVTGDRPSSIVLHSAAALAERHGSELEVLACVEPPDHLASFARVTGQDAKTLVAEVVGRIRETLRAQLAEALPNRPIEPNVAVGKVFVEIIRHVADSGCDFVVKQGESLSGVERFLFTSTDQHLLRKCPCPVWLQTATTKSHPRRVLAAVDIDVWEATEPETLTQLNRRVVETARSIATAPEAEVFVLHAWDAVAEGLVKLFSGSGDGRLSASLYANEVLNTSRKAMELFLETIQEQSPEGPPLVSRLARGAPEQVIHEQSHQLGIDVVVMGTVARTGLRGVFIGNTAENIINRLECSVLAVKPEGFISPLLENQ